MKREEAIEVYNGLINTKIKEAFEFFAPELAESEDERIRKEMIDFLKSEKAFQTIDLPISERWISYLEKQKELFKSGRGLYYYDGEKTTYCGYPATEENPYDFATSQQEKQKEQPKEELVYRLNGFMQEYVKEGKDEAEKEHRFKCYQLFWDALEDENFFEQKEQKHPNGCFTCDEYKKGYEAGRSNGFTAGYNKAMKEQKPVEKEITLTNFEETLNTFLFGFANSPIEDCEPKEYIKKHSTEILKAAYKELNAKLQQDIFEAKQEGIRDGYEVAKAEQEPVEWSEEDEEMRNLIITIFEVNHPDGFFKANELGTTDMRGVHTKEIISWLKSLRPQPKQEWSEEDEKRIQRICDFLWKNRKGDTDTIYQIEKDADWLKSLCPDSYKNCNSRWKPSEEQIKGLRRGILKSDEGSDARMALESLYNDLKKLM